MADQSARLFLCACCRIQVLVCRQCDRGQRYCADGCAATTRRALQRDYVVQIQHELMVSGAEIAHLWVFDGNAGILHEIVRDDALMEAIRSAWDGFQQYLDGDTPPLLSEADTVIRSDSAWSAAAMAYTAEKRAAEEHAERLDAAKAALLALAAHPRESGGGVSVTRFWKQGAVAYKNIPQLKGVELDAYRGKAREEVRVSVG